MKLSGAGRMCDYHKRLDSDTDWNNTMRQQ